jgi:enediyne polyketide synthase
MAEPLWGPYMERVLKDVCPEADISIAVELAAGVNRRALADHAMRRALGDMTPVLRRTDGKPEAADGRQVSASHARDLALAVAGRGPLACDVERVVARAPSAWRDMLGDDRAELAAVIIRDTDDEPDTAATRVWCACECLKKVGSAPQAPLVFAGHKQDGWVFLASGALTVASFVAARQGADERLVVSALLRSGSHAGL